MFVSSFLAYIFLQISHSKVLSIFHVLMNSFCFFVVFHGFDFLVRTMSFV